VKYSCCASPMSRLRPASIPAPCVLQARCPRLSSVFPACTNDGTISSVVGTPLLREGKPITPTANAPCVTPLPSALRPPRDARADSPAAAGRPAARAWLIGQWQPNRSPCLKLPTAKKIKIFFPKQALFRANSENPCYNVKQANCIPAHATNVRW